MIVKTRRWYFLIAFFLLLILTSCPIIGSRLFQHDGYFLLPSMKTRQEYRVLGICVRDWTDPPRIALPYAQSALQGLPEQKIHIFCVGRGLLTGRVYHCLKTGGDVSLFNGICKWLSILKNKPDSEKAALLRQAAILLQRGDDEGLKTLEEQISDLTARKGDS